MNQIRTFFVNWFQPGSTGFNRVLTFVGLFLLGTSFLKMLGLGSGAVPRIGWYSTPQIQITAIMWESFLGVWLISQYAPIFAWYTTLTTFIGFSIISGYLGMIGVANCGCLGVIQANPFFPFFY